MRTCVSFLHVPCADNKETIGKEAVIHLPLALSLAKAKVHGSVSVAEIPKEMQSSATSALTADPLLWFYSVFIVSSLSTHAKNFLL